MIIEILIAILLGVLAGTFTGFLNLKRREEIVFQFALRMQDILR